MCGIAGWTDWKLDLTQQSAVLEDMAETLYNRGPDAGGIFLSQHTGFAHRRLVVVDPNNGQQPMSRQRGDHTYTMVYNGELYNTEDIRRDLLARGYTFQGHSDTEVLLTSYLEWGPACVERFNGIFAFAIWDPQQQTLFIARDRLGVKPLFYTERGAGLLFASELKALLAHPSVEPEVDAEGLAEVFAIGPAKTPGHGVFRGVHELKPGHFLQFSRNGLKITQYWKLDSYKHEDDFNTTVANVRALLQDAVERQLVSDVPICTFLSGGLDSSMISAFAAQKFERDNLGKLHTFSIDYVGNDQHFQASDFQPNPDAPFVKRMQEFLGSEHHYIQIDTPQLVESLRDAMYARDLPGMADVDSSLLLFSQEIKQEATVGLSGECADEIFGGYPWFYREEMVNAGTFPWSRNKADRATWLNKDWSQRLNIEEYVQDRYHQALAEVPHLDGETAGERRAREMAYLNLFRWMPTLLDRKDRMTMAASLEVRVPFCDHRIVEYMWNVPWEMKFYEQREKGLLRKALEGVLPDDILYRKKSPYPKTHNPNYFAAVRDMVLEVLDDKSSPLLQIIDANTIREIAKANDPNFVKPWFGQLMAGPQLFAYLAQVDTWMRKYKVRIV
ncbi:asparagine synthase (glutamine-hydrolyzing) [Tumebacillus permanentifrigoris]|uniref:asparagine synthase (glutamine-hydrolyzing) n=1 Tax=Tumebacillus permanentifrigoris TaxID=378543 RepID=A0A316D6H2_9BACL|nr:asparagine synthase (glutamine-hydrolyzing) [Tumebacillus permanentifrigoris]PWK08431.1 asparagine synthase (glutamine-hydrolysing) [Tumebacillus permanentifrigoris]